jgi:hypothetical protein
VGDGGQVEEQMEGGKKRDIDIGIDTDNNSSTSKKLKIEEVIERVGSSSSKVIEEKEVIPVAETDEEKIAREREEIYQKRVANKYVPPVYPIKDVLIARPLASMKGHTAFLTFAVRPPLATK